MPRTKRLLVLVAVLAIVLPAAHLISQLTVHGGQPTSLTAGVGTPTLDGTADPGEWTSDSITTTRGVTIQAMMDGENFYILATWPDASPSVNQDHWTWDGDKWNASEDEDRLMFIWEMTDENGVPLNGEDGPSCQTMCHPGEGMAPRFGRVDNWHGKATRFLPVGFTDDSFWVTEPPDGRRSDSGSGSGDRNRNEAQTGPVFGPLNTTFLFDDQAALDAFNLYGTQLGTGAIKVALGENPALNEGDTAAGRILMKPTGNRASVKTVGRWVDGMWTWEHCRKLAGEKDEEGNPQDFTAVPGGSVRFVSEIFDNLTDHENHAFSNAGSGQADFKVYTLNFPFPTNLYFAQTGAGEGVSAEHVFTSAVADRMVNASLKAFDENGDPLGLELAAVGPDRYVLSPSGLDSSVDFQVPPLGAVTLATSSQGDLMEGAVEVTADNLLGGVIRFELVGRGIAGVGESASLEALIIPVRRILGGVTTGVALHGTKSDGTAPAGAETISLHFSLRGEDGLEVADSSVEDFPARGHMADFIDEIFPDYFAQGGEADNFAGTMVVTVEGGEVAATALELGPNPGEFTALPVTGLR